MENLKYISALKKYAITAEIKGDWRNNIQIAVDNVGRNTV